MSETIMPNLASSRHPIGNIERHFQSYVDNDGTVSSNIRLFFMDRTVMFEERSSYLKTHSRILIFENTLHGYLFISR